MFFKKLRRKILKSFMDGCGAPAQPPIAQGAPCSGGRVVWGDTKPRIGFLPYTSNYGRLIQSGCEPLNQLYKHGEDEYFAAACCPVDDWYEVL